VPFAQHVATEDRDFVRESDVSKGALTQKDGKDAKVFRSLLTQQFNHGCTRMHTDETGIFEW
jgi:hypothetical protein